MEAPVVEPAAVPEVPVAPVVQVIRRGRPRLRPSNETEEEAVARRAKSSEYNRAHREAIREYYRQWQAAHREQCRAYSAAYKARVRGARAAAVAEGAHEGN